MHPQSWAFPQSLTPRDAIHRVRHLLSEAGTPEPAIEAEMLVAHALGTDRTHVYALPDSPIGLMTAAVLSGLVGRRLQREPLAYITGSRWFYGLEFAVRPGVLIPRPETELLVEEALLLANAAGRRPLSIADVGTGCGNVAVALAVHLPEARIYAADISPTALEVARENARRHRVSKRVSFLQGDLLAPLPERVDMIVANLPYVRSDALSSLQPELAYEPRLALDGGADGLDVVRRLLAQTPRKLAKDGWLLLELDPWQMGEAMALAAGAFPGSTALVKQDLSGSDRMLAVRA